jgi:hypothetical protein
MFPRPVIEIAATENRVPVLALASVDVPSFGAIMQRR